MFNPESYSIAAALFIRMLGIIYFFALGALIFQVKGLIGKNGILPLSKYLNLMAKRYPKKKFLYAPTLFWINSSDYALLGVLAFGTFLSLCLILGIYPPLMLFLLYFIHLSIVSAGQEFLSFGWEGFLLEITVHAFFLSLTPIPNLAIWISINFLVFRFHFQAGAVKLQSYDRSWRDLTAIAFHYQTQPLPNTIAWYFHKLPLLFNKTSVVIMFIIEMIVPFAIFGDENMRLFAFFSCIALQFMIWFTGNFSYLNHLTGILLVILLSNTMFMTADLPFPSQNPSFFLKICLSIIGIILTALQIIRFLHQFFPNRYFNKILNPIYPFHLANRYGIFSVMTTQRLEVIVEGSDDGRTWKEYLFWYKPSEPNRRPRRISPYQPRLDWQAWFLPFIDFHSEPWFQNFIFHLLKGTPEVVSLLRKNPFGSAPPKYIRAQLYEYTYTDFKEKKENGCWWNRRLIDNYSPRYHLTE